MGNEHLMSFLLFSAFGCSLRLLVIQLNITAFLLSRFGSTSYNDKIDTIMMPVTTRSRAKLLTGSATKLSQLPSIGSTALSHVLSRPVSPHNNSHSSSSVVLLVPSTYSFISSSLDHCYLCGDDDDPIPNDKKFRISNLSEVIKLLF
jgi:hypothetical protein